MKRATSGSLSSKAAQSLLGGALAVCASSPVTAKTTANMAISAGGRIASNPFLEGEGAPSGQAVSLEIAPTVRMEGGTTTLTLQSRLRLDQYFKDYGTDFSADVGANLDKKFSDKTSVRANGSYRSSRSTLRDILLVRNNNPSVDVGLTPGVLADPTLLGRNRRNNIWQGSVGITTQPTRRDVVTADFSVSQLNSPSQPEQDYRYLTLQTSLSHRLSSRTSLQLSLAGGKSEYLRQRSGNGYTFSPMVGVTTRINSTFTLTALAGTTFSSIDRGDGTKIKKTTWSAQASLCHRTQRDQFCLSGVRNVQPTAIGGVRSIVSASMDYSRQLDEKNTLSAAVSYSYSGSGILPSAANSSINGPTRYVMASSTLTHRFNRRFFGYFTPSLEHVKNNNLSQKLDYQINFGVRYIIGEIR
jgi:hypothetical protein